MWPFGDDNFEAKVKEDLKVLTLSVAALTQLISSLNNRVAANINSTTYLIKTINEKVIPMAGELQALKNQVQELIQNVTAEGDAVRAATLAIQGLTSQQAVLTQQLQDAILNGDPAAIQAVADAISAQNDEIIAQTGALAAAIPAQPLVVTP